MLTVFNMNKKKRTMTRKKLLVNHTAQKRTPRFPDDFPFELLVEVFKRVPPNDLPNCKSVARAWRSFFIRPGFAQLYNTLKIPGFLLISKLDCGGGLFPQQSFYCSTLLVHKPQKFVNVFNVSLSDFDGVTQVVDGFLCCYSNNQVFLCNICSREIIRLPDSPGFEGNPPYATSSDSSSYDFGFDPINRVYKLLRISCGSKANGSPLECTILTIGIDGSTSSWRKVSPETEKPVGSFSSRGFLANGVLYWKLSDSTLPWSGVGLIAFDLYQENFRLIKLPDSDSKYITCPLVLFRRKLALFYFSRGNGRLFHYTLEDEDGNEWGSHEVDLPKELRGDDDHKGFCYTFPVGNLPTGEILFANSTGQKSFAPVYAYDHENNRFQRFVVGKFPLSMQLRRPPFDDYAIISCVTENLPLEALISDSGRTTVLCCDRDGGR